MISNIANKLKHVDYNESVYNQILINEFENIETTYVEAVKKPFQMGFGQVANVGSCALIAILKSDKLIVANSGDCRCVIGAKFNSSTGISRESGNQQIYIATQINRDHNARTKLEQILLSHNHPDESDIVKCKSLHACYVKGRLQLTHAIGDIYLKYPEFNNTASSPRTRYRDSLFYLYIYLLLYILHAILDLNNAEVDTFLIPILRHMLL
jgi:serine/threonine protein phosphatase PrpC